ncbi:MAG: hypothetical protein Q7S74_03790 [Nanoarchaeota archaeon]|nr:hypothetical protein [Nanoarchaeota archaeon]
MYSAEKVIAIIGICTFLFSFIYGGLYNDIYSVGGVFSIKNILFALLGSVLAGVLVYIFVRFIYYGISSIYYNLKR